jgi:hypothetical protein
MCLGVYRHIHEPGGLIGQRLAEAGRAPGDRVLVVSCLEGFRGRRQQGRRRVEIGEALRQVNRPILAGDPGHLADH